MTVNVDLNQLHAAAESESCHYRVFISEAKLGIVGLVISFETAIPMVRASHTKAEPQTKTRYLSRRLKAGISNY